MKNRRIQRLKRFLGIFTLTMGLCSCSCVNIMNKDYSIKKVRAENINYETIYTGDLTEGIGDFLVCDADNNEYTNSNWTYTISRVLNTNNNLYDYYINFTHISSSGSIGDYFKYIYFNFETQNFAYDLNQPNYFLLTLKTDSSLYTVNFEYTNFKNMIGDSYDFTNGSIDSDYTVCTYDNNASVEFDHNYKGRLSYSNTLRPTGTPLGAISSFYMFSLKISYVYNLTTNDNYYSNENGELFDTGYQQGYSQGLQNGLENGKAIGRQETIDNTYQGKTYQQIYNTGFSDGETASGGSGALIPSLFGAIVNIPISVLNGLVPLTFFDISIIRVTLTFLALGVVMWVIRKVMI